MNAIAIVPDDLLSAGDEMNLATFTEHLDKDYSKVSRKVSPTVLAAVGSLTENDAVIDTVSTVSDNLKLYSKREIQRADAEIDMFEKLGYPSEASIKRIISGGVLPGCDVTVEDVDRALSIYGKPVGLIK
eukprot:gene36798-biopygen27478